MTCSIWMLMLNVHRNCSFSGDVDPAPGTGTAAGVLPLSASTTLKLSFAVEDSSLISYSALILSTVEPDALTDSLTVNSAKAASSTGAQDQSLHRANAQVSSVSVYLAPKKASKYRWEWDLSTTSREDILNLARLGKGSFKAQIFLSPTQESGLQPSLREIGKIHIADQEYLNKKSSRKYPREWEMERYSAREELHWTFREPRKPVGSAKTLVGLLVVLSPWLLLAALVSRQRLHLVSLLILSRRRRRFCLPYRSIFPLRAYRSSAYSPSWKQAQSAIGSDSSMYGRSCRWLRDWALRGCSAGRRRSETAWKRVRKGRARAKKSKRCSSDVDCATC